MLALTLPSIRNLRTLKMFALFVELPAFERHRSRYLDDGQFRQLQAQLLANPVRGDVIAGSGGLRKMRFADADKRSLKQRLQAELEARQ